MRWLAPGAAVPASIGGRADQPPPSAMIAWLIEVGEQFLIDTEVCAPPGQVGGWTTPSAVIVPSCGPARPMTTVRPPACSWPRLAWNTVTEVLPEVVTGTRVPPGVMTVKPAVVASDTVPRTVTVP